MSKFHPPIFIKSSHQRSDVIIFGKGSELEDEDSRNGVSRFGGEWRKPSYFRAYLKSAAILIKHGIDSYELDDIALPAFYLQRHALELLIKQLLSLLYELADFRQEISQKLGYKYSAVPSGEQKKRIGNCHSLRKLFIDLQTTAKSFGFMAPPVELESLIDQITNFEKTDTWSRYESSKTKQGIPVHHVRDEIVLPITKIQQQFEIVVSKTAFDHTNEDAYENKIYNEWLCAARATGHAG